MPLAGSMCLALLFFYRSGASSGLGTRKYWLAGCAATGLAVLSKGLDGVVLVAVILAVTYALTRRPVVAGWKDALLGIAVFLAVVSAWYVPVTIEHGHAFIEEFFINHHFKRYTRNRYQHPQPVYFFPFILLAGSLPWTFFFLPAVARLKNLRFRSKNNRDYLLVYSWIWLLVPLIFFSFSWSKLPGYILPVFPAAAIIIANEIDPLLEALGSRLSTVSAWLTAGVVCAMGFGFLWYLNSESVRTPGILVALAWAPAAAAVVALVALLRRRVAAFFLSIIGFVLVALISSVLLLLPHLSDTVSSRRLSLETAALLQPGEKIAFYLNKEYGPVFYSEGRVACGTVRGDVLNAYSPDELLEALEREASLVVITQSRWERDLLESDKFSGELISRQGTDSVIRIKASP
jgi:4-amino-4-deoxy-L-arabinose transferase-like glycosyltransferase